MPSHTIQLIRLSVPQELVHRIRLVLKAHQILQGEQANEELGRYPSDSTSIYTTGVCPLRQKIPLMLFMVYLAYISYLLLPEVDP